jgi:N-acetylneuraminic acid mutarotase
MAMSTAKLQMPLILAMALLAWPIAASAQGTGHWVKGTKFAPLSEPAEEYWSATANGKFYLFGGSPVRMPGKVVLPGRVIEYDPATDTFTSKKQMPRPSEHMTIAESGDKIYLFGGLSTEHPGETTPGNFYLKDSWEYDPANDSWKALAPMPEPRQAGAAVAVNGKIYVIGGDGLLPGAANPPKPDDIIVVGTNEVYDPAMNEWATKRQMPTPRNHEAIGAVNGKVYVIGGRITNANVGNMISSGVDAVEEYDPATDSWRALNKMPTARSGVGWGTYQGMIYVLGGESRDYHEDAIMRDMEAFNPATNEWFRLQPMPTARHGVNVAVIGNRLHAIGGHVAFDGTGEHDADTGVHEVYEFGSSN